MAKFSIFIKPNALSKTGDTEFSTEAYNKVFNKNHQHHHRTSYFTGNTGKQK